VVNLSTGACATCVTLRSIPGTMVGARPLTVIVMVVAVLPFALVPGFSKNPDADRWAKLQSRILPGRR